MNTSLEEEILHLVLCLAFCVRSPELRASVTLEGLESCVLSLASDFESDFE